MKEIWKPVVGFEKKYEVSNLGTVRKITTKRCLKQSNETFGKSRVCLCFDGIRKMKTVSNIVIESFIGNIPNGKEVCHNNGNAQDNRLANLRIDTHVNNIKDKFKHGTIARGERHGMNKFKQCEIDEVKRLGSFGVDRKLIQQMFRMSKSHVQRILTGGKS